MPAATAADCDLDRMVCPYGLALDKENNRFRIALEIIAGRRQCVDSLMSNAEVAAAALDGG